jgi:hypothetical protein
MEPKPDHEFDAYLYNEGRQGPLCDVRLWIPNQPSDNARIEVLVPGVVIGSLKGSAGSSLVSSPEAGGLRIEAQQLLIRSANSQYGRKAGGTRLNIVHIGRLLITRIWNQRVSSRPTSATDASFLLSELEYAVPRHGYASNSLGEWTNQHPAPVPCLVAYQRDGRKHRFLLDRHWTWSTDKSAVTVTGTSCPLLKYMCEEGGQATEVEQLSASAKTVSYLLSLAARWRVIVHGMHVSTSDYSHSEWEYPLERLRAQGLERAEGRLVEEARIEEFVRVASKRLVDLQEPQSAAIHHAIVVMHPTTEQTTESGYLARFVALERIARAFVTAQPRFPAAIDALQKTHPAGISGIWPIIGAPGLPGLYALRNALAHGDDGARQVTGALSAADDHLRLWIEYYILSILGFRTDLHSENWLARHALEQSDEVTEMRKTLSAAGIGRP